MVCAIKAHLVHVSDINPSTAGAVHIRFYILYQHITYQLLNLLKKKSDINQQDLKYIDLYFVESE